ncbi:MAG: response regulator [Polyangia bacterium]|jgi:DNA-binding NtrC family response regulator|nr:response regulator [Polyangia bacterium]
MKRESDLVGIEILVVDGDESVRTGIKGLLGERGFLVTAIADVPDAIELIRTKFFAVVLCDLDTPDTEQGVRVVQAVVEHSPATTVIVLSPRKAYDAAVAAFRAGATDIVVKDREQVAYLADRVTQAARKWKRKRDRDELLLLMADVHEGFLRRMRSLHKEVVDIQDRLAGRDILSAFQLPECRVLVVDHGPEVFQQLSAAFANRDDGWVFHQAQSGGEALDIGGREKYHLALIRESLADLPASMVTSTLRAQSPETIYLQYGEPGSPGARVVVAESERTVPLVDPFGEIAQLSGRLDEIREGFKAKARERRYLQSFRTIHFDFLKKYAELNKELQQAKEAMSQRARG